MKRDAIDLGTVKVFTLFKKYFIPTLFGMLSMSAVTAISPCSCCLPAWD